MSRLSMGKVQPAAYKAMDALDQYVLTTSIGKLQREIIKIRASQINGCAYCVNEHTQDARKFGETEQRINLIAVWREAGDIFTEEEQVLLSMTEQITLLSQHGLDDQSYEKAIAIMGEQKTAQAIMAIITINAWNRIGVSLHMHPAKEG